MLKTTMSLGARIRVARFYYVELTNRGRGDIVD